MRCPTVPLAAVLALVLSVRPGLLPGVLLPRVLALLSGPIGLLPLLLLLLVSSEPAALALGVSSGAPGVDSVI